MRVVALVVLIGYAEDRSIVGSRWWPEPAQHPGRAAPTTATDTVVTLSAVDGEGRRISVVCIVSRAQVSAVDPTSWGAVVGLVC
jgi:hypothetical protein